MSGLIVIWNKSAPQSYKRVLFRYNEARKWRYKGNWKCNLSTHKDLRWWHWNFITPFFRFQKCNGQINIGLGNHYVELGW